MNLIGRHAVGCPMLELQQMECAALEETAQSLLRDQEEAKDVLSAA
jgi:hypothetical protein